MATYVRKGFRKVFMQPYNLIQNLKISAKSFFQKVKHLAIMITRSVIYY